MYACINQTDPPDYVTGHGDEFEVVESVVYNFEDIVARVKDHILEEKQQLELGFVEERADMERTHRSAMLAITARQRHSLAERQREIGLLVDDLLRDRRDRRVRPPQEHVSLLERWFRWWFS